MKLTLHQEKIIEAIIAKDVYDIPSYLEYFQKSHMQQYDFDSIKAVFEQYEDGRTYMFRKGSDSYYYTDTYDRNGNICSTQQVPNRTTHEFVDYPIPVPVKAHLTAKVKIESYSYNSKTYTFDFLKESHPVADSFDDIIDFITLWSYLKREALVLEVDKPVSKKDISIFFELTDQKINPNANPYWSLHPEFSSDETSTEDILVAVDHLPDKDAQHYIEQAWKLNEENLLTCAEFISKKIIASSELRVYQRKKFKTVEQIAQRRNLFVAWVAVAISVLAVLIGNILPLFKPQTTDYLSDISVQIASLEESSKNDNSHEVLLGELQAIYTALDELSKQQLSKDDLAILEDLETQLKILNTYLSESTPD